MMNILGMEPYDEKRCRIFLDGSFYCLLYRGEIRRLQLHEGGEISSETVEKIEQEILFPRARCYVMHLLERREQTEYQVRKKLREHLYPDSAADYGVSFWKERGYIDDFAYAKQYIQSYGGKYSWRVIQEKLLTKGISRALSSEAWDSVAEEELAPGQDRDENSIGQNQKKKQKEALKKALYKKTRTLDMSLQNNREKVIRHLLGKGFVYTDIQNELKNL